MTEKAKHFAAKIHVGQCRGNKRKEQVIDHAREVAEWVALSGGNEIEISGAWLHDSVEDTPTTIEEIFELFGPEIGEVVDGMTDPDDFYGLPLLTRKRLQAERIISKNARVKRVKLADQISNVNSVAKDPPIEWNKQKCIDYVEGAKLIAAQCRAISEFLDNEFVAAYQRAMEMIKVLDNK